MEGVMMRGPKDIAVSVRKPDGEIVTEKKPSSSLTQKNKLLGLPIVRGCISFFESMITSMKALMFSAEFADIESEEEQPSKFEAWLEKVCGDKLKNYVIYFSVFISLVFSIGLFILLPTFLVGWLKLFIANHVILALLEGVVRILIFLGYLLLVSRMPDIQRVFEYHGAEHKTIACYESGEELTVENAKTKCRLHPRCGTSFLLIVMVISILVFSFLKWDNLLIRCLTRLALLPVVAGISYEIIKFAGRHDNPLTKIISAPGLCLQKITTREPDDGQLEVAIASMKAVLTGNPEEDAW